jgi:TP901 family phage tail tape measure protein
MPNIISVVMTGNVSPLTAALAQGAAQLGRFGTEANRLGQQSAAAAQQANRLGAQSEAAAGRVTRLGAQADQAAAAAARLRAQADAGGAGAARLGQRADEAAARAARLRTEAAAAGAAATRLAGEARLAAADAERLGAEAERAGQRAQRMRLGLQAAVAGAGLFAAGLVAAVNSAVSFEAAMRQVASIDESVRDNFDEMSQAVLNLAKDLPQSANVLAAGLYNIAGSGFYGAEALSILEISAKAAAAGMTTTDNSAKAIVATLNAYGLEASEAGRVSDALFNVVNYGVLSYEELTAAVAHFIGNSAAAGVSIEQAGAALATMTLSGLSASEAGVSLNNMLAKLIKPTGELEEATGQLGISLEQDLKDPAIGLSGVMEQLRVASDGNLKTLLSWFSEIRATRGALALMSAEGENYKRVLAGMGTEQANANATQKAYAEVAKSTAHQFEVLTGSIQSTAIELGLKFLPYVNQAISFLMDLGGAVGQIASEVAGGLSSGFADWGSAIRDVASALDQLNVDELVGLVARIGISALVGGFNLLAGAVSGTTGFLASNTLAVQALVAAWLLFNAAAIARQVQLLATSIALGLVNALSAGIRGIDLMIARLRTLGNGSLWRGVAVGAAGMAVVTGTIHAIVSALGDMKRAKEEAAAIRLDVSDVVAKVDGTTLASYEEARRQLLAMAESAQRAVTASEGLGSAARAEALLNYARVATETSLAVADLDRAFQYANANVALLSQEYGITEDAVVRLAEAYDVDLSQALDAAGEGGATLREAFSLLVEDMVGANATSDQVAAALEALDTSIGGAEEALKELNLQMDFFTGKGVDAVRAADAVDAAMEDLADGTTQLTGSLTAATDAGRLNREAIFSIVDAIEQEAQAVVNRTGSYDEGRKVYEQGIQDLRNTLEAAGRTTEEIDALFQMISGFEVLGDLEVGVTTPGLAESTTQLQTWNEMITTLPPTSEVSFGAPGLTETITEGQLLSGLLGGLPPNVSVPIDTPGAEASITESQLLGGLLGGLPPGVSVPVGTPGAATAITESQLLSGLLGGMPPNVDVPITTPGIDSATAAAREFDSVIDGIDRNVWVTLTVTQRTAAAQLMGTVGRLPGNATGGPIRGPGSGTSDDVPIMASNGEWVIRAAAAQMYGRQAMAAVNAGRALVVPMMATGGPVGRYAVGGPVASAGTASATGATGAIQLVEKGGQTLAEVYAQTAAGVGDTADALRDVVPRLWDADRSTGYLATTTGLADQTTGLYRETLTGTTTDLGLATLAADTQTLAVGENTTATAENLVGLQALGVETDLNNIERSPLTLLNTQAQTLATQEETLADTERLLGLQLLGVETDLNTGERMPAVLLGTQTQTLATQESTLVEAEHLAGLTLLGTQWDLASSTQLPTLTAATDVQTISTTLGTAATVELTGALVEETAASGQTTAALGTQTAATDTATASANTATAAANTFAGALGTVTAAANTAAGAVNAYVGALNSIPPDKTTTITTNFVTTGTPAPGATPLPFGAARGGMVTGPGTSTSDSILAALSAGEWVIRAQAAAKQGPYRMALLNAGLADVVPRFATGGPVPGFATGGTVRPAVYQPYTAGGTTVVVNLGDTTVTVNSTGGDPHAVGRAVRAEVDAALSDVVRLVRSGTGRR